MRIAPPIAMILAAAVVASLAVTPAMAQGSTRAVTVAEEQSGTTIELSRGQRLVIRLGARAGTGYSWALRKSADEILRLANSETRRDAKIPGASAAQIFTFLPTAPGSGEIEIAYRRPWLKDKPPARTYRLRVVVRDVP